MSNTHDENVLNAAAEVADGRVLPVGHELSADMRNLGTLSRISALFRENVAKSTSSTPERWGQLVLMDLIGKGGFGDVYRAWDSVLHREVALKLRRERTGSADAEVMQEARSLARVRHPNVLAIHGVEINEGWFGMWCDLLHGRTLESLLGNQRTFTEKEILDIGHQLAQALQAVHEAGLVHGDIKLGNTMLATDGHVTLMDFGAAAHAGDRPKYGSPQYMAPECLRGSPGSPASDVYSLGVLMYRLATGGFPHSGSDREELLANKTSGPCDMARLGSLSAPCRALIECMLAPDKMRRPHAEQIAERIGCIRKRPQRRMRNAAAIIVMVVAVLLTASILVWQSVGHDQRSEPGDALVDFRASIAVLPFELAGGDVEQQYLAEGLSETIIQRLSEVAGIKIAARSSSFPLANKGLGFDQIAERLGVATILHGSVRLRDDQLRVYAELVRTEDGAQLWSARFDDTASNIFNIQDRIADHVVTNLLGEVLQPKRVHDEGTDIETYELYLRGKHLLTLRGAENVARSVDYFKAAVARDADFAAGWSALASAYLVWPAYSHVSSGTENLAFAAAQTAIALDPANAQALAVLASLHQQRRNWLESARMFQRAIDAQPGNATVHHWYGEMLAEVGRWRDSETQIAVAVALDPLAPTPRGNHGWSLLMTGKPAAAERECRAAWDMGLHANFVWQCLFAIKVLEGNYEAADRWIEQLPVPAQGIFRPYLAALESDNDATLRTALDAIASAFEHGQLPAEIATLMYAMLGAVDKAYETAHAAILAHRFYLARTLFARQNHALQADPRFPALVRELGIVSYWHQAGWSDLCRSVGDTLRCSPPD